MPPVWSRLKLALISSSVSLLFLLLINHMDCLSAEVIILGVSPSAINIITSKTTRNYRHKSRFNFMVPKSIPFLTPQHKENRVTWCEQHIWTRWNRLIFSDESRFELYYAKIGRWSRDRPKNSRPKFSLSLMIWGYITFKKKSPFIFIKGTIDSLKYQEIFQEAWPKFRQLHPRGFTFQQNGATPHRSRSTEKWLWENQWHVTQWPVNSLDLNPI